MSIRSIARAVGATIVTSSLVAASILIIAAPASAAVVDVYDTIPDPHQSDRASLAYSSNSITEFGSTVELAVGTDRTLHEIEIGFSNWSCETGFYQTPATPCVTTPGTSFVHPVTVNLYADAGVGTAGALIATVTKQVTVPFRPSASAECTDPSRPGQYQDAAGVCTSGLFFTSVFDFSGLALTVPDRFTIGVTYNTSNSGFAPIGSTPIPGTNAGYDALNVAIEGETPPVAGVFTDQFLYATVAGGNALDIESGWGDLYSLQATVRTGVVDPAPAPGLPDTGSESPIVGFALAGLAMMLGIGMLAVVRMHRRGAHTDIL